jgi:hypothetical protein
MSTSEYKVVFDSKKKKHKEIKHVLTLDEYDELTFENQILGAKSERGNIVAELERRYSQLQDFSRKATLVSEDDQFAMHANGLALAIKIIADLPDYEDNVGCPECEAF